MEYKREDISDKAEFANKVLDLIFQKHDGNLTRIIEDKHFIEIYNYFQEYVRNIYEVIDTDIPLFYYYELKKHGVDNYWFGDISYDEVVENTHNKIFEFHK